MPDSEEHSDQNGKPDVMRLVQTRLGDFMSLILTFGVTYSDTNVTNSEILHQTLTVWRKWAYDTHVSTPRPSVPRPALRCLRGATTIPSGLGSLRKWATVTPDIAGRFP
jgi:hypothetical protein